MKKQVFILLVALLAMASNALAYDFSATAPSGQTLYYNIVNGEAHVVWHGSYNNYVTGALTIPSSVTYNGTTYSVTALETISYDGTFENCSGLTSVTIPNSVTSIGESAFSGCTGLTSLTIPNSVTSIDNYVFYNCSGLTSITIPNSVTSIGHDAFKNCGALTAITIPNSVTSIGESAFSGCTGLTSLTIPNSVTAIRERTFENCYSLTSVTIPNSITNIYYAAFGDCANLTSVNYTGTIAQWCNIVFWDYSSNPAKGADSLIINGSLITNLIIPESVTKIKKYAFYRYPGLTSVTIGSGVASIGDGAFSNCNHLVTFRSKAIYPPTLGTRTFENIPQYCTLIVPCGSQQYYSVTSSWNSVFQIIEEDCGGIEDASQNEIRIYSTDGRIVVEDATDEVHVYDLEGRIVRNESLPTGVYLVKIGDLPARRVVVIR